MSDPQTARRDQLRAEANLQTSPEATAAVGRDVIRGGRATSSKVDDQLQSAGMQRMIEGLLELRRVRRVEVSVEHKHL